MTEKKLSLDEVAAIRKKWNPDKAFAHGLTHGDLENKTYYEIVDGFNKRISEWYFDTIESLPKKVTHYNFPITIFCCIIVDLLSQYIYCTSVHKEKYFTQFLKIICQNLIRKLNLQLLAVNLKKIIGIS